MIDFQLLVGAGFAVVFHNFRGSRGYGSEFSHKIVGSWGPAGALDHHAAVDEAIRAGIADADRIGVCGYSHGAFATTWLVGTSDRFKAAVAENGSTDWTSKWGNTDWAFVVELEMGGTPFDTPDTYRELSALAYARSCRTPLLFVIGEGDMRCHPVESEQYYRVLKSNGVPTEMLRLPNSSHLGTWDGPIPARIAQNKALVEWFERYLTPSGTPKASTR
jgi:dipeptidyl aminopeptidase/acylaminoacyl peptidase